MSGKLHRFARCALSATVVVVFVVGFFVGAAENVFARSRLDGLIGDLVGTPYRWGGTTPEGFDCSGFTAYVFGQLGVVLPHSSREQAKFGHKVDKDDLRPGDLVFFNTSGRAISHVGIYVGDGLFAHSSSNKGVVLTKLNDSYYAKRFVTARRILTDDQYRLATAETDAAAAQKTAITAGKSAGAPETASAPESAATAEAQAQADDAAETPETSETVQPAQTPGTP